MFNLRTLFGDAPSTGVSATVLRGLCANKYQRMDLIKLFATLLMYFFAEY